MIESFDYEDSEDSPNYKSSYSAFRESVELDEDEGKKAKLFNKIYLNYIILIIRW